ncbi:MAG: hypothetical protein DMF95_01485 [Acidobacteria bacterium]|nr:MAG: hypothetical protein DMF96_17855 [Acidobacteriota bacterium]PYR20059.1 MAG: hypothetical protein DMF94_13330 [Acidobacteriota bacterium]PYR54111.1 MAG: hypothetical protein DMF95_01485 [Acidobacteriota bacterium]
MRFRRSLGASTLLFVMLAATPARAQLQSSPSPADSNDEAPSFGQLFTRTLGNFGRLPSVDNLEWLTVGGAAALATHPADADATRVLANAGALHEPFKAGAFLGGGPFELGAAFATYGVGRALHNGRAARVGADLIQAQLMAESLAFGVKQAARRPRPSGSGFSFPSGHTTVTFASATVLQQHFGWRIGIPAYAVASYVATSRIQQRRHYLSDVAFAAALGTIAGRTVTVSRRHGLAVRAAAAPGGAGVALSWIRP